MVWDFEWACRELILEHIDEATEDSVGTQVTFDHVAAGLLGGEATVEVEVIEVLGRRVTCLVSVSDDIELLGHGTHTRAIVDAERTQQNLLAKQAKVDTGRNR